MKLPDPSLELQQGRKVVVFVHHLVPGLDAEELDKYRRMDDATLEAARAIPGQLGHEFARTTKARSSCAIGKTTRPWPNGPCIPCTKRPSGLDTLCSTRPTGPWCARWTTTGSRSETD